MTQQYQYIERPPRVLKSTPRLRKIVKDAHARLSSDTLDMSGLKMFLVPEKDAWTGYDIELRRIHPLLRPPYVKE